MSTNGNAPTLEERRLALDELKAQQEHELASRELDLKSKETGWISRLFTPLTTTASSVHPRPRGARFRRA